MKLLTPLAAAALLVLLAGCSSGSDSAGSAVSATPTPSPTPSVTPTPTATATATATPTPAVSTPPTTTARPTRPAKPTKSPTKAPPSSDPGAAALASVRSDVESIAPQLESYYRDREYPVDLAQVRQTLAESGVILSSGNTIGGYVYDGDAVEFRLCIQNTSGAWATYDTAPMTLRESGATGGCPAG